jgi:hypothetical protein
MISFKNLWKTLNAPIITNRNMLLVVLALFAIPFFATIDTNYFGRYRAAKRLEHMLKEADSVTFESVPNDGRVRTISDKAKLTEFFNDFSLGTVGPPKHSMQMCYGTVTFHVHGETINGAFCEETVIFYYGEKGSNTLQSTVPESFYKYFPYSKAMP